MNKVNPLHLVALACVVVIFVFFQTVKIKKELYEAYSALQESKKVVLELVHYQKKYSKKVLQNKLNKIVAKVSVKDEKVNLRFSDKGAEIEAKSLTLSRLNRLMTDILNKNYKISSLEIKRIDGYHAALKMEIVW